MAIPTNLPNQKVESAPKYLKNLYVKDGIISSNQYDELTGLLQKRAATPEAADNLAAAVIQGAAQQNMTMTDMIQYVRNSNTTELDAFLAFFLNNTRVGTSYLGVANANNQNPYIIRTILV